MITQELLDYIKQQFQLKISEEEVKKTLIKNGWEEKDVKKAIKQVLIADKKLAKVLEKDKKDKIKAAKEEIEKKIRENDNFYTNDKSKKLKKNSLKTIVPQEDLDKNYNYKKAGFWIRIASSFLDLFIGFVIGSILLTPILLIINYLEYELPLLVINLIPFIGFFLYLIVFRYLFSGTLGEKIYGLNVVNKNNGEKIGFLKSNLKICLYFIIFSLGYIFGYIIFKEDLASFFGVIAIFVFAIVNNAVATSRKKRALEDFVARTEVIRTGKNLRAPVFLTIFLLTIIVPGLTWSIVNMQSPYSYLPSKSADNLNELDSYLKKKDDNFKDLLEDTKNLDEKYKIETVSYSEEENNFEKDSNEIYNQNKESIVSILTNIGIGTGFVVHEDGLVVTNYHVIDNAKTVVVGDYNGGQYEVEKVVDYSKEKDLIILKIKKLDLKPLTINSFEKEEVKIGEEAISIGHPIGLQYSFSKGYISGRREIEDCDYYQFDTPISMGNSGGPIFNKNGNVFAVASFMYTTLGVQNLNFGVDIQEIENLDYNNIEFE